jgi:hypothetical protein
MGEKRRMDKKPRRQIIELINKKTSRLMKQEIRKLLIGPNWRDWCIDRGQLVKIYDFTIDIIDNYSEEDNGEKRRKK